MAKAFFNTLTVTIPATIIPILIAAFAAYALAWMDFPGRALLIAAVVGLLVVPLQLALIPLLKLHNEIGIGKGYLGVWLAHTGFGLPLAIYLLRNYMVGLPRDIIENAKVDGATDFQIFTKIILPLSFPALASFAIFQFLWTWNDLLVAMVFLIDSHRRDDGDDAADRRAAGHPRRQLGDPGDVGLRVHRRAAGRVLLPATLPRPRPAGRVREIRGAPSMATLKLTNVDKTYGGTVDVLKNINLDIKTGRTDRVRRPVGLRQVHAAADDRGAGEDHRRRAADRRPRGQRHAARRSAASRWCSRATRSIRT